jgi:hypothetical protein
MTSTPNKDWVIHTAAFCRSVKYIFLSLSTHHKSIAVFRPWTYFEFLYYWCLRVLTFQRNLQPPSSQWMNWFGWRLEKTWALYYQIYRVHTVSAAKCTLDKPVIYWDEDQGMWPPSHTTAPIREVSCDRTQHWQSQQIMLNNTRTLARNPHTWSSSSGEQQELNCAQKTWATRTDFPQADYEKP